jgi:cell wall-associated NlpC family hydrolase
VHGSRIRARGRRAAAALALTATVLGLFVAGPAALAHPKPPPNPTNGQISAAQRQKQDLADRVGELSSEVAQKKQELLQLEGEAELAEQKYALAVNKLQIAQHRLKLTKAAALRAQARVVTAQRTVTTAHDNFVRYIQATYMSGGTENTTAGSLLTATDPSTLLEQGSLEEYQSEHQIDAIGQYQRATVEVSNAEAAARKAVQEQADATTRAKNAAADAARAKQAAEDAVTTAQAQRVELEASVASTEHELAAERVHLATLNHERAKYIAYQKRQAAIRRARRLARERARRAAERRARLRAEHGGGDSPQSGPSAPVGGAWTAAKGEQAARRALSQVGTPYAWAGGGASGPSRGVCSPSNGAPNDCNVIGYDCSGLALYAWGQHWAHYAATQYGTAGHYHPSASSLRPGDLIFWSFGGLWAIHHVAIYIGNGEIVEAPYSGGYVQVASLYEYGGFYGATRPLT